MTTPTPHKPRNIADLDVPAEQVAAEVAAIQAAEGALLEQRHQYLDLDADSACCLPGFVCPACPPNDTPGETR